MKRSAVHLAAYLTLSLTAGLTAAPLIPGNFLISDEVFGASGRIREFTPAGVLVQTQTFTSVGQPRDIAVDANGNIQIYDGTFAPTLTTLHPSSGAAATHTPFSGWSTVNGTTLGGLATFGHFVYATDMTTYNGGEPNGIIRFDGDSLSGTRFASSSPFGTSDYIDLNVGMDGLLYALWPEGVSGVSVNQIDVYDPLTLAFQRLINMPTNLLSIAVDVNGDIFAGSSNDDLIHRFDRNGNELGTADTDIGFTDIDIDRAGRLLLASGSNVLLTDRSLSTIRTLHVTTTSPFNVTFATWVDIPEPYSQSLASVGIVAAVLVRGPRLNRGLRIAARASVNARFA
jgi:hypothetical protein